LATTGKTKTTLRACAARTAVILTIGVAGAAHAQVAPDPVDLQVVDRATGRVLPVWRHHGRIFVAGEPGARYGLRVSNHTDGRVLVVMSVDGVNVLTGETAGWNQRGYVFWPRESYDVIGWRKSATEVAAFTFAPLPQSYAARTGRPADVGVIGIAVFNERQAVPPPAPETSAGGWARPYGLRGGYGGPVSPFAQPGPTSPAAPSPMVPESLPAPPPLAIAPVARPAPPVAEAIASAAEAETRAADLARSADEKLGTAHGAREWSVVDVVPFERTTPYPQFTLEVEYDTYANLVAAGVIRPWSDGRRHPRPFPSSPEGGGYVPDPPDDP